MRNKGPSQEELDAIMVTTETVMMDLKITDRLAVITAESVEGIGIFKETFANIRDFVGGRNKSSQNLLHKARVDVLRELKREAHSLGANAVVAVDLDYSEISGAGKSMLLVVASGTAVVVEAAIEKTIPDAAPYGLQDKERQQENVGQAEPVGEPVVAPTKPRGTIYG